MSFLHSEQYAIHFIYDLASFSGTAGGWANPLAPGCSMPFTSRFRKGGGNSPLQPRLNDLAQAFIAPGFRWFMIAVGADLAYYPSFSLTFRAAHVQTSILCSCSPPHGHPTFRHWDRVSPAVRFIRSESYQDASGHTGQTNHAMESVGRHCSPQITSDWGVLNFKEMMLWCDDIVLMYYCQEKYTTIV